MYAQIKQIKNMLFLLHCNKVFDLVFLKTLKKKNFFPKIQLYFFLIKGLKIWWKEIWIRRNKRVSITIIITLFIINNIIIIISLKYIGKNKGRSNIIYLFGVGIFRCPSIFIWFLFSPPLLRKPKQIIKVEILSLNKIWFKTYFHFPDVWRVP